MRGVAFRGAIFGLALFKGGIALAQTTGSISGTVSDTSAGPLPGATVEATSTSLQGVRTAVTRSDGTYWIPALPPGRYTVKASLPGFNGAERTATVALDATATVGFTLELLRGEVVHVTGEAPLIDIASTTTGTNYTSKVIARLPVARNYADIVRSNPGVNTDLGETQGRSLALTVYGATSAENQWIVDGINTTNVIKGIQGKAINAEFVQEVDVKTGGYQAEYGRALGGVINVITKSGGNEFHGDAFGYYDSIDTKAKPLITSNDSVATGMRVADYRRSDFGADLGGYLWKDRLWFFAAYDRIDSPGKVARYESSLLVPNTLEFPLDASDSLYSGKLTWKIAEGTTFVATAFADPTVNSGAGGADPRQGRVNVREITNPDPSTWEADRRIGGTDFAFHLSQLLGSSGVVTVQASHHEDRYELGLAGLAGASVRLTDQTCSGGSPAAPCQPPPGPNFVTGGFGRIFGPQHRNDSRRNQYRADVGLFLGDHELKAGGDYQDASTDTVYAYTGGQTVFRRNERGQLYYLHRFFAKSATDLTPVDVVVSGRTRDLGAYLQDTWRIAPGWTVSAGLRWDEEDIRDYRNQSVIKTTADWQPRLGVIWDPWKDGKTKVHAFAGLFYYAVPTDNTLRSFFPDAASVDSFNFDPVSTAQDTGVLGHPSAIIQGGASAQLVDPGLKGIYQNEVTIGLERMLAPTFSVGLRATYRRLGRAIEDRCDLDYSRPETNYAPCGILNPGSDGPIARGAIPGCNGLDGDAAECSDTVPAIGAARRIYRGIELLARKSFSEKLWLQASYVYSSLRGNYNGQVTASGQTDPTNNADFDYPALQHNDYGRLYLDRPHSFRVDGFYSTQFKLTIGLSAYVRSGAPLDKAGYFNSGSYAVQLVEKGYAGRQRTNWDASLTLAYPILLGPVTVTAQAYVFNVFNNQFPVSQDTSFTTSAPADYPASLYDPNQAQNNPEYGKVTGRQEPRLFRAAVRVSF